MIRLSRVWRSNKLARSFPFWAPTRSKIVHRRFAGNANQNYLIKFEINMHYKPLERVRYNWIVRTSLHLDFCCHLKEKWLDILTSGVVALKGLLGFKNFIIQFIRTSWRNNWWQIKFSKSTSLKYVKETNQQIAVLKRMQKLLPFETFRSV